MEHCKFRFFLIYSVVSKLYLSSYLSIVSKGAICLSKGDLCKVP